MDLTIIFLIASVVFILILLKMALPDLFTNKEKSHFDVWREICQNYQQKK